MNHLPALRTAILTGLGKAPIVHLECARPRKLARELGPELRMCDIKVEREDQRTNRGVLRITWKTVT